MSKLIDLAGQQFGYLIAIRRVKSIKWHKSQWLCQCECGKRTVILGNSLKSGNTQSCGCIKNFLISQARYIHGHSMVNGKASKTYGVWQNMKNRCNNPNDKFFNDYGGRGIRVCKRWLKFENFLADMSEKPEGLSLDRIDNDGNYCKSNCRWTTIKIQQRNTRHNILFTIDGVTKCLSEWC